MYIFDSMLDHIETINTKEVQDIYLPKVLLALVRELSVDLSLEALNAIFHILLKMVGKIHPENSTLHEESSSIHTPENFVTSVTIYAEFYNNVCI